MNLARTVCADIALAHPAPEEAPQNWYRLRGRTEHGATMSSNTNTVNTRDLIEGLCLEAGRIMEELSADLAIPLPDQPSVVDTRLEQLLRAATTIMALAQAAQTLARTSR